MDYLSNQQQQTEPHVDAQGLINQLEGDEVWSSFYHNTEGVATNHFGSRGVKISCYQAGKNSNHKKHLQNEGLCQQRVHQDLCLYSPD